MFAPVERRYTVNHNSTFTCSGNSSAASVEIIRQVLNGGDPFGGNGCQENILRGSHTGKGQVNPRSLQAAAHIAGNAPVFLRNVNTQFMEGLQMQINGTGT